MDSKVDFLAGQHHALLAAVYALIATHERPEEFKKMLDLMLETATSKTLPTAVSEQYMQGFQEERDELMKVAQTAARVVRLSTLP